MRRRWARQAHAGLLRELEYALSIARDEDRVRTAAPAVSAWSIRQHLEHLWLVDLRIVGWLRDVGDDKATTAGRERTPRGAVVMWLGRIPRGRGRAPKWTMPTGSALPEIVSGFRALQADVAGLEGMLQRLAASDTTLRHPILGCYTPAEWLRFVHIHHVHHRRIIDDIGNA